MFVQYTSTTWNATFEEYSKKSHTVNSLRADMLKIGTWEKELEKVRVGQTIGILHVGSRKLKQMLLPMTADKMESIKGLVKELARTKCRNQLMEYKQRTQLLMERAQHLKEFAAYVEKVHQLKSSFKALIKATTVVDEMYRLINNYGVQISSEDMVQLDDLRSVQDAYKDEGDGADKYATERMEDMNSQVNFNIERVTEQLEQFTGQLYSGLFVNAKEIETYVWWKNWKQ